MFDGVPDQFHQFLASSASAATARTTTLPLPLPLPLSFSPLHNLSSSNGFTSFDPLFTPTSSHHQVLFPHQLQHPHFLHPLHQHHQQQPGQKTNNEEKEENSNSLVGMSMAMEIERARSITEPIENHHPWSNDEVLALFKIRSSTENWFPEFTWEHVSRKLAELGFKRSAEKCKEKFEEEESRYFNNNSNSINCGKNYRIFSELEEFYQGENPPPPTPHHNSQQVGIVAVEKSKDVEKSREDEDNLGQNLEDGSRNIIDDDREYQQTPAAANNNNNNASASEQDNEKVVENLQANNDNQISKKKRIRQEKKFELIKGFCEDIVNKLMNQQEEMHNKLLEDMLKRDEEKVAREEAWKKQELDRLNQELEIRAKEQAVAGDRQATIIKILTKLSSSGGSSKKQSFGRTCNIEEFPTSLPSASSSSSLLPLTQNPNLIVNNQNNGDQNSDSFPTQKDGKNQQNPNPETPISSSGEALASQNPNSVNVQTNALPPVSPLAIKKAPQTLRSIEKDVGKRWPRDEVLALINLRSSLYNNGDHHHDKEGGEAATKAPLWERISQRMLELGYKRSAKRCKEKWENINKYFRKTKDVNKKRSLDSRTCPYFHHLSTLYNQGTLISPSGEPGNRSALPENHSDNYPGTSTVSSSDQRVLAKDNHSSTVNVSAGETNMVQVPSFEFEF